MKPLKRNKLILALITVGGLGLAGFLANRAGAAGETQTFAAGLLGSNEVAAGDPDATASAMVRINSNDDEFCWDIQITGLGTITAAHLHNAAAGANGPVKIDFSGSMNGCLDIDGALADDILAKPATYYLNVHTNEFPAGAVRGQLDSEAEGPLQFSALKAPVRAYDSRQPNKKMAANETRAVVLIQGRDAAGVAHPAVPVGAVAAQIVITATDTSAKGFLSVHAAGTPVPGSSAINWASAGSDLAVGTVVPVDATGRMAITAGPASETHVIIDVVGYYFPEPTLS
jgi:CHRD domain